MTVEEAVGDGIVDVFVKETLKSQGMDYERFETLVTHLFLEEIGYIWEEQARRFSDLTNEEYWRHRISIRENLKRHARGYFESQANPETRQPFPSWMAHRLAEE